jgi:amino acid adenylation domain-containing protein
MIIQIFEEQVIQFSDRAAVTDEHRRLTYNQLNRYANRAANAIRRMKAAGPVVGLLFQHGIEMVAGVLATLKAEMAYLPLDFSYPENRLAYMLEDAGAGLIVTNNENWEMAQRLAEAVKQDIRLFNLEDVRAKDDLPQDHADSQNITRTPSADRMAYILYTSGSTGKPKGVTQTCENVCYYVRNWIERFRITPSDRMTFFTAFSHDGAGQDIFGALHAGALLYPYNILNRPNIGGIIQWLNEEQITIWHSVPTIYRYFVNTLEEKNIQAGHFPALRSILLGGEQVRAHDIRMFNRFFPGAVFANVYGQTESSVNTVWLVNAGEPVNKMLIGEPFDKTQILIVDEEGEILEDLGIGEIFVACAHITPGYWKNEEAGEGRFIDDPDLGRLYRTGDLGRLMTDGSIEFMGRKDAQVKIRGFRIETGEIETRLLGHPEIKEAVTAVKTDENSSDHLCAYFVTHSAGQELTVSQLREYLSSEIPEYMIPSYFIQLEKMPLTPNGKVDRKQLPEPEPIRPNLDVNYVAPETTVEKTISAVWKELLNLDRVGVNDNFFDLGGTSFDIIKMMSKLYDQFEREIPVVSIFQYPTIRTFVNYLKQELGMDVSTGAAEPLPVTAAGETAAEPAGDIAVIGMACRFPGAHSMQRFWENLESGKETISFFTSQELIDESHGDPQVVNQPNFIKARGIIGNADYFDALFFNYSPLEARVMEPQLRVMHEVCWEVLENAGYDPDTYAGSIGLYAGNSVEHYWNTLIFLNNISQVDSGFMTNNYSTVVSYKLNLKGPSIALKTACSTSLVAIHLGRQGLMDGECDIALAGGVSLWLPDKYGYFYQEGMVFSQDGHVYPFDARAGGTVFGNGAGMVALKKLADAQADGDTIYAVIKGAGINNDGHRKVGLASPSVEGQAELIRRVLRQSRVHPETITYMEAHGTGTILGDPVEVEALKLAYATNKKAYCKLGSVKSNVGHLNIAAGVSGFIKTVLSLYHRRIPPSINFEAPNPKIDFENSPFVVNTDMCDWDQWSGGDLPLRAGVSAFGIGGTNAHAILEEAPAREPSSPARDLNMLLLSAASKTALEESSANLGAYLKENPGVNLSDVAYTLQVGRKANKLRKMLLCSDSAEAVTLLETPPTPLTPETGKVYTTVLEEEEQPVIFMFPGQGAQYVNMGLGLYRNQSAFREAMDRCFDILAGISSHDFKNILYPDPDAEDDAGGDINQTGITQPMLFIFEYAMARLLMRWGFTPFAMIGHSIGEYVAACLSGVFTLEEALRLVALRGRLMQQLPTGSMLSVALPEDLLIPLLTTRLSLATVNTTASCVVSGDHEAIDLFEQELKERGYDCRRLHTSHAFHSAMMDPILDEFRQAVAELKPKAPVSPYISNVSGTWITVQEAADPSYWVKHLRGTVRFEKGLRKLLEEKGAVFLEVGPGRTLSTFVRQHEDKRNDHLGASLVRHPRENMSDTYFLMSRIGRLWLEGKRILWQGFYTGEQRHRIPLPTYPFQRQRFWLEGNPAALVIKENEEVDSGKRLDLDDWFFVPAWQTSVLPAVRPGRVKPRIPVSEHPLQWLILRHENDSLADALVEGFTGLKQSVAAVQPGTDFSNPGPGLYHINPGEEEHYRALFKEFREKGGLPERIIHMWNLENNHANGFSPDYSFYSLLHLARAVTGQDPDHEVRITLLTQRAQAVNGDDVMNPLLATALGALKVIPLEFPNIDCRAIDIDTGHPEAEAVMVMNQLLKKGGRDSEVAFRDNQRWVKAYEPYPLDPPGEAAPRLKQFGAYLVTGGLGGIGLALARFLAQTLNARLVLTGRRSLPPREEWPNHPSDDRVRGVMEMEEAGAEVLVLSADVADGAQMQNVIRLAKERFGKIDGVIHSAGVADGGLIQVRTKEMSQRVFDSKIQGTLVLDDVLKDEALDFFLLCSSVSSVAGTVGQVAYSAANAFMDHFAYYKTARDGVFTVSVNWDAWREVGMAVEAVKQLTGMDPSKTSAAGRITEVDYPFFRHCEIADASYRSYVSYLTAGNCWFLDEHRINGKGTMPGTGYLELARAAAAHTTAGEAVELRDVLILAPLMLTDDEEKEVRTVVKQSGENLSFSIISRLKAGEDKWLEHCRGMAGMLDTSAAPVSHSIAQLEEQCGEQEFTLDEDVYFTQYEGIRFGPRWDSLRRVKYGHDQAIGYLKLPGSYASDLEHTRLHPALLDVGTLLMKRLYEKDISYIPVYYKRVKIMGPLTPVTFFHAGNSEKNSYGDEALKYDIYAMDEQGRQSIQIEGYTLRRPRVRANVPGTVSTANKDNEEAIHPLSYFIPSAGLDSAQPGLLRDAISPVEGVEAFRRVLTGEGGPQVVVATTNLNHRLKRNRGLAAVKKNRKKGAEDRPSAPKAARPELTTDYVAPGSIMEKKLAGIFQELLGINQVGVYDDFFELGGDSLKAVNFGARIHKELDTEVPITEFFNRPNIKMLAELIGSGGEETLYSGIPPVEEREYYPLSSAQERLYVLSRVEGVHTGYNLSSVKLIRGRPDIQRIRETFQQIIRRHESLRTSFELMEGKPVQRIHENAPFELEFFECDTGGVSECIRSFIRPFDLEQAPLVRFGLIKLGESSHVLITDVHHIVFDGISFTWFYADFYRLYIGVDAPMPPIQYKDYTEWQKLQAKKGTLKKQEEYWLNVFEGEPPILSLPYDFPRPALQRFEGDSFNFRFDEELTRSIRALSGTSGATQYMLLLGIFYVLIHKLSGQEDILVGTPVGGRSHGDLENLLGMFVNTLVLRQFPSGEKTFEEFLEELKRDSIQSFDNQDYPFEELVGHVVKERDFSRNPVFDVMFSFIPNLTISVEVEQDDQAEMSLENYGFTKTSTQFDLTLGSFERNRNLDFTVEYCTALFKVESIRRFMDYFKTAALAVTQNPRIPISDIDILSLEEKEQLLDDFNDTAADYPREKTLHQLFEEQARQTPGDSAVFVGENKSDRTYRTYEQLAADARNLAVHLRGKGAGPGKIIGIMVDRHVHMLVGLLAILKTGAAYLPMDPGYPEARVNYILEKSGAALLLTRQNLLEDGCSVSFEGDILDISDESLYESMPAGPAADVRPPDPAYVIYTSGSTGNPKGVMVSHRNAVNFIAGMREVIDFKPGRTILALTTVSFDIFFLETLLPLTLGMTVALADEEQQRDPVLLADFLMENRVDMVQMTPSRLQLMLEMEPDLKSLAGVHTLMIGGEAFPAQLHRSLKETFKGHIYNMYGPTETTIWSAVKDLTHAPPGEVTIGRPIANTQIYIVNKSFHLQPLGVAGELLIGGDGVASGYLNNDKLTAEKFINKSFAGSRDGFSKEPLVVYRTGDLARWLPDGDIQFLGRMDQQVKIRGFRVELDEIEEQLLAYAPVKEAVVIARGSDGGEKRLCAYLVPSEPGRFKEGIDIGALKEMLSQRLPHYMIPEYFVPLEKLPLTPNGKIDRKALPEPGVSGIKQAAVYVAPQSGQEQQIAEIWQEILNVEQVGVNDNFFDIGGNSLNVIQLGWKLGRTFGKEIPVAVMFRNLSIGFLVDYLDGNGGGGVREEEADKKRVQSLDKSKQTYKDTISKLTANRRRR